MTIELKWESIGKGQPLAAQVGDITVYKFPDGHASCSVCNTWISALFASPEAALSWDGAWDEAEIRFREINPPTGLRSNLLPARS